MTEELRAKQEYDEERDRVSRPRSAQPAGETGGTVIPKPWEGITEMATAMGINLGELWKSREQELSEARASTSAMEKELHELRVREIDHRVAELQKLMEEAKTGVQGNVDSRPATRHVKMEEAIDNLIASRLDKLLGGNDQTQLTREDIKQIAVEASHSGNQNSPQQMVDTFVSFLTAADAAKKRLVEMGGGSTSSVNPYLNQAGSLRGDVLKVLLENDLQKIKLQNDYDIQQERNKHLGALAGAVKNNIEDIVAASKDMVKGHRESRGEQRQQLINESEEQGGFGVRCSECGQVSVYPDIPTGTFECQHCGAHLQLQQGGLTPPSSRNRPQPPGQKPITGVDF